MPGSSPKPTTSSPRRVGIGVRQRAGPPRAGEPSAADPAPPPCIVEGPDGVFGSRVERRAVRDVAVRRTSWHRGCGRSVPSARRRCARLAARHGSALRDRHIDWATVPPYVRAAGMQQEPFARAILDCAAPRGSPLNFMAIRGRRKISSRLHRLAIQALLTRCRRKRTAAPSPRLRLGFLRPTAASAPARAR
jgi:hypothetical protein